MASDLKDQNADLEDENADLKIEKLGGNPDFDHHALKQHKTINNQNTVIQDA